MCHHSGFNKINNKSNKRGKSKNTECKARIDVKIKLTTKDTCKKDKYVKVSVQCNRPYTYVLTIIYIYIFIHLHTDKTLISSDM